MRSSKSRSRNKSNRQRSIGNVINRVFDSSGPEGKVRGTPQQIIDKYLALARDAQLGNDRVAEQNFLQHAEHYTRMLGEAQREMAREQEERQRHFQNNGNNRVERFERDNDAAQPEDVRPESEPAAPDMLSVEEDTSGLVETPEMRIEAQPTEATEQPKPTVHKPKADRAKSEAPAESTVDAKDTAERKPRRRVPRKPAAPKVDNAEAKATNE